MSNGVPVLSSDADFKSSSMMEAKPLEFALIGAGFWSQFQLSAWDELGDARCIAIVSRNLEKASHLAERFNVANVYSHFEELFKNHRLDFVDIVTSNQAHAEGIRCGIGNKTNVVCQKPLVGSVKEAILLIDESRKAGVTLSVHENWRWQRPLRQVRQLLNENPIGDLLRARVDYNNSFPVFDNQPAMKELGQFILWDMGTHLLDVCRFLFGEPVSVFALIDRSRPDIRGEDMASVHMRMENGMSLSCSMSYASRLEVDRFPETFVTIEGTKGSIELSADYWISTTTADGTVRSRFPPMQYKWVDPRYELVQSSIVDCNRHLLTALRLHCKAETDASDNVKTLAIVEAAYRSAQTAQSVIV